MNPHVSKRNITADGQLFYFFLISATDSPTVQHTHRMSGILLSCSVIPHCDTRRINHRRYQVKISSVFSSFVLLVIREVEQLHSMEAPRSKKQLSSGRHATVSRGYICLIITDGGPDLSSGSLPTANCPRLSSRREWVVELRAGKVVLMVGLTLASIQTRGAVWKGVEADPCQM